MATFKIAHIKEQGVNVIIVPLATSFGDRAERDRIEIIELLQAAATEAQLRGKVVPMWQEERGYKFIAPPEWQPYFRTVKWKDVLNNLNREIACQEVDRLGVNSPHFKLSRAAQGLGPGGLTGMVLAGWNYLARKFKRN